MVTDKKALSLWDEEIASIRDSTEIRNNETPAEKAERMRYLEAPGNEEKWKQYYFPKYCFSEPAPFQIESSKRIYAARLGIYQRRAWARGLAKTTRRMMEIFYLGYVQKLKIQMLMISKTYDNAERLLESYRANLTANQRLINDYGRQERPGSWEAGDFKTLLGWSFRAVGASQNPRGSKNEELRINVLAADDIDDDEVCRNPDRLDEQWLWLEQAVMPTVEISKAYYIFIDNNIIAEDSIAVRAAQYADDVELVNIRDEFGFSVWAKNTEEAIDKMLKRISYESGQKEYFNNPMKQGKTFKEIHWDKCPPLSEMNFVVVYADPAPSNRDLPTEKSKQQNSCKSIVLVGKRDDTYYVYNGFVEHTGNSVFVGWLYTMRDYIDKHNSAIDRYYYIENNSLQDAIFEGILKPIIYNHGKLHRKGPIVVLGDERKKLEKWTRIEATLEPLNRQRQLIFNIEEKNNEHMKRLEKQFLAASPRSKLLDGPDAVEGGVTIIKEKSSMIQSNPIKCVPRKYNDKRI